MRRFNFDLGQYLAALGRRLRADSGRQPERGSAVVEFVFLGLLLLLPVVYLIVSLAQLQGAAYAATGAADQASKVYLREANQDLAEERAEQVVLLALQDFGFDRDQAQVRIDCLPTNCQAAGTRVTVVVKIRVPLPLVSSLPGVTLNVATMEASASQIVGRFR